jgi:hypothetical protein
MMKRQFLLLGVLGLTACDSIPSDVQGIWTRIEKEWSAFIQSPSGSPSPAPSISPTPSATENPDSPKTGSELTSTAARNSKANAEILQEVFKVIYMRDAKDRSEFGNWVDTLNQGASIEGVYNGLIHSAEYRKLELGQAGASVEALRVFAEELALLEVELSKPTQFDANPVPPPANVSRVLESPGPDPKPDVQVLAERYSQQFVALPIFALKRILGEEALKLLGEKSEYREKLALWYSKWVVHMSERNVDFGIPLRNTSDEVFHYKWVLDNTNDRVKWEVLNRLHRVMNEANKVKQ